MTFPWEVISQAELASGHVVEDLKLGLDLARIGYPPLFHPLVTVTSYFPSSVEGTQRTTTTLGGWSDRNDLVRLLRHACSSRLLHDRIGSFDADPRFSSSTTFPFSERWLRDLCSSPDRPRGSAFLRLQWSFL